MGTDDLTVEECCVNIYRTTIKRLLDIILSACGILLLSPLFLILMLAVYIDDPGPVFLRQKRWVSINRPSTSGNSGP